MFISVCMYCSLQFQYMHMSTQTPCYLMVLQLRIPQFNLGMFWYDVLKLRYNISNLMIYWRFDTIQSIRSSRGQTRHPYGYLCVNGKQSILFIIWYFTLNLFLIFYFEVKLLHTSRDILFPVHKVHLAMHFFLSRFTVFTENHLNRIYSYSYLYLLASCSLLPAHWAL